MSNSQGRQATRGRRVTAQTVAELAGVSRSAVSRAFTPGAYLDDAKRRKILEVAAQAGYQPNALAAGLKGGQSHLVAVFVGDMRSPYDNAFLAALTGALNAMKKWPILIDGSGQGAAEAVAEILRYPLDALILRGGSMTEEIVTHCARLGIPMISSGRPVEAPGVDTVCCRHAVGTRLATERLVACGRRRIACVNGPEQFYSSAERRRGVVEALDAAGLALVAEDVTDYTVEGGEAAARRLLAAHDIDALVCANDASAIGALSAAQDMGRRVPEDLGIVGFDDIAMARWPNIALTTVHNPIEISVAEITALLASRLDQPGRPDEMRMIDPWLVERGTH